MGVLLMMPQIHFYVIYLYSLRHWVLNIIREQL